jgi:hypothetical protein
MAERSVSRPITTPPAKKPSRPAVAAVESEEPRARFIDGANPETIFKDPAWADQADALVMAIFAHGHLKRIAEAVAGDICIQAKAGKTLAEIAVSVRSNKSTELHAAYRAGLDEAPRILKGKVKEPPRSTLKEVLEAAGDEDEAVTNWTKKLLADKAKWETGRRRN